LTEIKESSEKMNFLDAFEFQSYLGDITVLLRKIKNRNEYIKMKMDNNLTKKEKMHLDFLIENLLNCENELEDAIHRFRLKYGESPFEENGKVRVVIY
jgi:hypothetical protein